MRHAAFSAAASCSGVSRRSSPSSASAVSCSGVLTSGVSGEIAVLAVHPIGATAAYGTAARASLLQKTVGAANTAVIGKGRKDGFAAALAALRASCVQRQHIKCQSVSPERVARGPQDQPRTCTT